MHPCLRQLLYIDFCSAFDLIYTFCLLLCITSVPPYPFHIFTSFAILNCFFPVNAIFMHNSFGCKQKKKRKKRKRKEEKKVYAYAINEWFRDTAFLQCMNGDIRWSEKKGFLDFNALTLKLFFCELVLVLVKIKEAFVNWWGIGFIIRIVVLERW